MQKHEIYSLVGKKRNIGKTFYFIKTIGKKLRLNLTLSEWL